MAARRVLAAPSRAEIYYLTVTRARRKTIRHSSKRRDRAHAKRDETNTYLRAAALRGVIVYA